MTQTSRAAILKEIEDGSQAIDGPDASLGSLPVRLGGTAYRRRYTLAITDIGESRTKNRTIEDSMQKSRCIKAYDTFEASQRSNYDERLGAVNLTTSGSSGNLHQQQDEAVLSGWLHKTNRPKWTDRMTREPHEHRQHRRFKLTEHSLEHSHLLQRVCQTGSSVAILIAVVHITRFGGWLASYTCWPKREPL